MREKIKTLAELVPLLTELKKRKKKIVQCHGVFDLVHPGHIRHFAAAKRSGDILVVTLTADRHVRKGPGRPVFNERLRAEALAALQVVDYVSVVDFPTAIECIRLLKPDVYAKGSDYKDHKKDITGKISEETKAVRSIGGRLVITDDVMFSSSSLLNQYLDVYPPKTLKYLKAFAERISPEELARWFAKIASLKVLVIGDAIVDQYHTCLALDRSSKENLVVHKYLSEESFAGGALATANHVSEICKHVDLVTVLGRENPFEAFIRNHLGKKAKLRFFYRSGCGTTVKRRFLSTDLGRKVFEICYMDDSVLSPAEEKPVLEFLKKNLSKYDLVIVADYGHGMITPAMNKLICQKSKKLCLNVQSNSANLGFNLITKYRRADFACIDEKELRLATHDKYGPLPLLVKKIQRQLHLRQILVTRGSSGSLGYDGEQYHEAPAFSYQVVDKIGAGDAFFAFTAPCFAAGMSQDLISLIGNGAGSLAVQIVCNRQPVKYVDLMKFLTRLLKF